MGFLLRLFGLGLIILGIYFVGQNIFFATNVYPYWWRGISADASVLALTFGVLMLIFSPEDSKNLGWISVGIGILLVFISSRAILNPTSLWDFLVSLVSISLGYKMLTTGRSPF